jgi:Nif-specific regulatory protein
MIAKPLPLPAAPALSPSSKAGPAPGSPPLQGEEPRTPATDDAAGQGAYQEFSKDTLIQAMEKTGWVQAEAARLLRLTPRQIGYALKKHGIEIKHF